MAEERKVDVEVNHKKAISIFHKEKVSDVYNYKSGDNQKTIRKKSLENWKQEPSVNGTEW